MLHKLVRTWEMFLYWWNVVVVRCQPKITVNYERIFCVSSLALVGWQCMAISSLSCLERLVLYYIIMLTRRLKPLQLSLLPCYALMLLCCSRFCWPRFDLKPMRLMRKRLNGRWGLPGQPDDLQIANFNRPSSSYPRILSLSDWNIDWSLVADP